MNPKLCVCGGGPYTDIDCLACAVAFAELNDCAAFLPGKFNSSIPESVRKWDFKFSAELPKGAEEFVLVDFSNPNFAPHQVPLDKVIKVYDHHTGFEDYWAGRGKIEFIGACATMIYELFENRAPSATTANLLYTAIFANTLNFKAAITTNRDRAAFEKLKRFTTLGPEWIRTYYSEIEKNIIANLEAAIASDTKMFENGRLAIAQLELYDARPILDKILPPQNGFVILVDIGGGKDYLFAGSPEIRKSLSDKLGAAFDGNIGTTDRLLLRKEIVKIMDIPR